MSSDENTSRPTPLVLQYEKPAEYRYQSDLPPPGWMAKAFWRACYESGKLLGLIYKPRPAPRLYTPRGGPPRPYRSPWRFASGRRTADNPLPAVGDTPHEPVRTGSHGQPRAE